MRITLNTSEIIQAIGDGWVCAIAKANGQLHVPVQQIRVDLRVVDDEFVATILTGDDRPEEE